MFRARKRALEVASEQRITQLEKTIERMGDTFLTLVDHVIQSNQHRNDPELNAGVYSIIRTFLTLGTTSSDPSSDHSTIGNQGDIPNPAPYINWKFKDDIVAESTAELEEAVLSQDASALYPSIANDSVNTRNFLNQLDSLHSLFPEPTGSPINILGNGWTGDVPFSYTASLDQDVRPPAAQSISNLIVQATLYYVYHILLEAADGFPSERVSNIFRYALKLHSRDELLFNLRWFLGPGQREAYRLSKTGFQILDNQGYEDIPTLSPSVDSDALNDAQAQNIYHLSTHETLVNADGVESYLLQRKFRRIAQDILEVNLEEPLNNYKARQGSILAGQSSWLNLDFFFPTISQERRRIVATSMERASTTRIVRFSETKFMRLLATQASHCLAYGPGYQRNRLHNLIEAAAIPSPEIQAVRS